MKLIKYIGLLGALLLLAACTSDNALDAETPEIIEADIQLPDEMAPEEEYPLQVAVSQGGEPVTDAEEVLFELWNDSEGGESIRIEAEHVGEGVYEISRAFEESGIYTVQTHVTARSLHIMPKRQFQVGEVTQEQVEKAEENANNQESKHMESHENDGHH